jgi:phosphate starvation-inducible PhoH-like protein
MAKAKKGNGKFHMEFISAAQKLAWAAFQQHDVLFMIGPAGTGKTFLSMAFAISEILQSRKRRIILTRPIVEAGESLGYLPGFFEDKVAPYMVPLMDAMKSLVPEPPQKDIVGTSIEMAPIAYLRGRAQPLGSKIITPNGFKLMKDIEVGDDVASESGFAKVIGVYPQGKKQVYSIVFSDGSSTECCEDHLWLTQSLSEKRHNKNFSVKSTKDIIDTIKISHNRKNHKIPIAKPVEFISHSVSVDPYFLGLLLGDGSLHKTASIGFSTKDIELLEYIQLFLPAGFSIKYASGCNFRLTANKKMYRNPLKIELEKLGLLGAKSENKFIPDIYKFNSIQVRLGILRGLLDTDGWIGKCGYNHRIQFYTISEQLAKDVMWLVRSLGGVAYYRQRDFEESDSHLLKGHIVRHTHSCYVVDIKSPHFSPFLLKRKSCKYTSGSPHIRLIAKIVPIGEKECQCIQVDSINGLYLTDDFIVTHNTFENAVAIFDEAQNATKKQLKLFLTRLGKNSKIIINGDPSQSDIGVDSGLVDVLSRLETVPGVSVLKFREDSIVRHPLVAAMLEKLGD